MQGPREPRHPAARSSGPRDAARAGGAASWFRFLVGRIGDYDRASPIVVSRTGYTGELGYEVCCHPDDGPAVWDAVLEAGAARHHAARARGARHGAHRGGLIFAGYEFDDQVDPFEAGIGFAVALDNEEDFIGREALEERSAHPQRGLVGLELEGNESAGHGDSVYDRAPAHRGRDERLAQPDVRKPIALCRMAVQYAELGTERGDRQARRAAEADPGDGRALPVLRPGQDAAAVLNQRGTPTRRVATSP